MKLFQIAAIFALLFLVACGAAEIPQGAAQPTPSTSPSVSAPAEPSTAGATAKPLLTITTRGGMCPNNGCATTTEIATDGTYEVSIGGGPSTSGKLAQEQAAALVQQVEQADFDELSSRPFTGTCPIAFDGQELIYTFHTDQGDRVLESCTVEIDATSPLFQTIEQAQAAMQ